MKVKGIVSRAVAFTTALSIAITYIGLSPVNTIKVEAAQKVINIKPVECKNVDKILPEPTKHMKSDAKSKNYSYIFKIVLPEASKLRITGLARYTFWNGGGDVNYKLTDALNYYDVSFTETWETGVYADHSWEERLGNYCDETFILNKGTYYLFVNTDLASDWREQTFGGSTITDYPSGLWLSINRTAYVNKPVLKSVKNSSTKTASVVLTKVSKARGYQVQYSTNKKFSSAKTMTVSKNNATLKSLKKGKTYYIRCRAYRILNGKKYYSAWSNVMSAKIRK